MKKQFLENRTHKELQSIAKNLGYSDVTKMGTTTRMITLLCGHTYYQLKEAAK